MQPRGRPLESYHFSGFPESSRQTFVSSELTVVMLRTSVED